jgi:hypothetical protein
MKIPHDCVLHNPELVRTELIRFEMLLVVLQVIIDLEQRGVTVSKVSKKDKRGFNIVYFGPKIMKLCLTLPMYVPMSYMLSDPSKTFSVILFPVLLFIIFI